MGECELKVDFPKDAGGSKYMKELSEIENEIGVSIKVVVQIKGKPGLLEVARKRISEIKCSDKANPVDFKDIHKSILDLQNVSQNNIHELKTDFNIMKKEICESNSEKSQTSDIIQKQLQDLITAINVKNQEIRETLETQNIIQEQLTNMMQSIKDDNQDIKSKFNTMQENNKKKVNCLQKKILSTIDENTENFQELFSNMISNKIHQPVINMGQALKLDIDISAARLHEAFKLMEKNVSYDHKVMSEMVHKQLEFGITALKGKQEACDTQDYLFKNLIDSIFCDVDLDKFYRSNEYIQFSKSNGVLPIHTASALGRIDVVKKLIQSGTSVDLKNNNGWTPLHYASQNGHLNIVKYLINVNASINAQTNAGDTALTYASWKGHKSIVEYLCSKKAKVDIKSTNGCSALSAAGGNDKNEIIKILKKYGA